MLVKNWSFNVNKVEKKQLKFLKRGDCFKLNGEKSYFISLNPLDNESAIYCIKHNRQIRTSPSNIEVEIIRLEEEE